MMAEWTESSLSLLCESFAGGTPSRSIDAFYGGDIPWVKSTEVNQSAVWSTSEFLTVLGLKMSNCKLAPKNSVLIAMYGATAGQVSKLKIDATTNQAVLALVCKSSLCSDYLFYTLIHSKEKILYLAQGSGQPNLSKQLIDRTKVKLPPLPQQKKIAKILSTVDNLIEQTRALIDKYTAIKQGMMADLFTRGIDLSGTAETNPNHGQLRPSYEEAPELYKETELGWVPREWDLCLLGALAEISSGITLGNVYEGIDAVEVPYLRVANVQDGYLDLSEVKKITISKMNLSRYRLKSGDVLMNEGGDFDKLGRGTIWKGEIDSCCHQNHVFKVRTNRLLLMPEYLSYWSASPYGKKYFVLSSKQSTNLASINSSQLKKFPVLIQSSKEQIEIVRRLHTLDCSLLSMSENMSKYEKIKKGLMQDLLTGKVRVNP
jgi:type I restriction enzyme S subunit